MCCNLKEDFVDIPKKHFSSYLQDYNLELDENIHSFEHIDRAENLCLFLTDDYDSDDSGDHISEHDTMGEKIYRIL